MLKCASLYTSEVDDPDLALKEIRTQLDEKITLLEYTVGIVMCNAEFIASGVLRHICANLPFDLAGVTTASQAVNDGIGELMLTVFVMSANDVRFITGVTESLSGEVEGPVKAAFESAAAGLAEPVGLALIFPPFGLRAGDAYVKAWERLLPGTPLFGTCAIDDTATFAECETIYNGVNYKTAMPFVLCCGNIKPRFLIATLSESNAVSQKAEVTKARGNCVFEINYGKAINYFIEREFTGSVLYTPFMIDLLKRGDYDGVPVIRGFAAFTEEGAAVFHGDIDEGSTFTLLKCDPGDILLTTRQKVGEINRLSDVNGVLLFPCAVRRVTLLCVDKSLLELQAAREVINPAIPYMMGYAGGEICPTSVKDGVPTNRFHNYSLVILVV
ncbi:MAG: FIST C-terminal domain-containing protein [Clostridiales bacterium]|nr:FIST C-terminal domain-containing protein [Clostridiales bacterium]